MPVALGPLLEKRPFVLLEDRLAPDGGAWLYSDPVQIVRCDHAAGVPDALAALQVAGTRGLHAAGFLGYELGYALEERLAASMPAGRRLPLLWFGLFQEPTMIPAAELDRAFASLPPPPPLTKIRPLLQAAAHAERVGRVQEYLHAGDAYQINLTFPIHFRYEGSPLSLYAALRANQPAAHGGIVAFDAATLLSVSPELFLETSAGRATSRPMKGTAARRDDPRSDRAAAAALPHDPKQRAENLMIVDLMRNDLGRVSVAGSVEVPTLFGVESYPTLHTMTSIVTSTLRPGLELPDLVRALFPSGSITGAPKLRAMQIIRELEDEPRDVYTGSIGAIAPNGDLRFNVAIRTATLLPDGSGSYGAGSGIVADSQAASEFGECLLKARVLTDLAEDYGLVETLRWSPGEGYVRLPLHLARLARSAAELGFLFDRAGTEARLEALAASFGAGADRRVRLELRRSGEVDVAAPVLDAEPDRPLVAACAGAPSDAGDPFLRHKTTRRASYDAAAAAAREQGADEAILRNRAGFITEATRNNVFVARDGLLLTPPLADGVLPGVLRQSLLASGEAVEARLRREDLLAAERWFLGNSARGLRPARLAD